MGAEYYYEHLEAYFLVIIKTVFVSYLNEIPLKKHFHIFHHIKIILVHFKFEIAPQYLQQVCHTTHSIRILRPKRENDKPYKVCS